LLEVVGTLHPRGVEAHLLHGGQEQADQNRDDRDHHQQLDQRERFAILGTEHGERLSYEWDDFGSLYGAGDIHHSDTNDSRIREND